MPASYEQMEAAEAQIAATLGDMNDVDEIIDTRDRIAALETYLRGKMAQMPALGAQRRLEARIGQLLGEAQPGGDRSKQTFSTAAEMLSRDQVSWFRTLAKALNGKCSLDVTEWRQSRSGLVALIKQRTKGEEEVKVETIEVRNVSKGAQIAVPEGMTAESLCRQGLAFESEGDLPEAAAKKIGVGIKTYRSMRDIVSLYDRTDLSAADADRVTRAVRVLNATNTTVASSALIEPVANRLWGAMKDRGGFRDRHAIERARMEHFDHVLGLLEQACSTAAELDVPYLSEGRAAKAIEQVDQAVRNLSALKRHISEVHG